jgi:acetolactate synthase-1/2/3 large subunit
VSDVNGAELIADYLVQARVPYVVTLCGHGNLCMLDALAARQDEITTISVHHEAALNVFAETAPSGVSPAAAGASPRSATAPADVAAALPADGILLSDVGAHHNWIVQEWRPGGPGTLLQSWGFAGS